jgi:tRNA dimethylallyltransferase
MAMSFAKEHGGEIINADRSQCYKDLDVLTASPSIFDKQEAKHHLYNFLEYNKTIDVVQWAEKVAFHVEEILAFDNVPILVGGSGFYIKTLLNGISVLPKISKETRANVEELSRQDYKRLCEEVFKFDPYLAAIINQSKHRQIIRAYEIMMETGKSIRHFFEREKRTFLTNVNHKIYINIPEKKALYKEIDFRFEKMIKSGAIDQVKELLQKTNNNMNHEIFTTIGAIQIAQYLTNKLSFEEMVSKAQQLTRNYAKRQTTWFKNQRLATKETGVRAPVYVSDFGHYP